MAARATVQVDTSRADRGLVRIVYVVSRHLPMKLDRFIKFLDGVERGARLFAERLSKALKVKPRKVDVSAMVEPAGLGEANFKVMIEQRYPVELNWPDIEAAASLTRTKATIRVER